MQEIFRSPDRKLVAAALISVWLIGASPIQKVFGAETATRTPAGFVDLARKLAPIVVNISTTIAPESRTPGRPGQRQPAPDPFGQEPGGDPFDFWRRFFGDPFGLPDPRGAPRQGLGSGFIIDANGLILTNNHVVENADKITVRLPDRNEYSAEVVGRDPRTDIAVIRISEKGVNLPVAPLGDSSKLEVGEWVIAMGSPFGLDNSITAGIVSAKGRWIGAGAYDNFIQTDASINPGNSGGPLINMRGEVVGINTAIFSRTGGNLGIGFAIPINLAKDIVPQLVKKGKVTRGWLGVSIQRITPELAESLRLKEQRGALVAGVEPGSPAEQAGIKTGDVIVEYNGEKVTDSTQLPILVAQTDVGKNVKVSVLRDQRPVPLTVNIGELKDEQVVAKAPQSGKLGLTVQDLTPQTAERMGLKGAKGVVITAVEPQSPAAEAGLRPGDIVLEGNRKPINTAAEFKKFLETAKPDENLLFLVRRGEANMFLVLRSPSSPKE
ncbi:MAG: DegQ family serine endoprotease [Candidatus Binatia bacterium]